MNGTLGFTEGWRYPLVDSTQYDDSFGSGYSWALIPEGAGPEARDCYVHDAWIINEQGEIHPGLSAAPVPVHVDDVDFEQGKRMA